MSAPTPKPAPSPPEKDLSKVEEKVRQWPRAYVELWVERAGIHLDNGDSPSDADEKAFEEVSRWMKANNPVQGGVV